MAGLEKGREDVRPTDQVQVVRPAEVDHELVSARSGLVPAGMGAAELKKYAMFNVQCPDRDVEGEPGLPDAALRDSPVGLLWVAHRGREGAKDPDGLPLLVARLRNRCEGSEGTIESYTIVTRPPTPDLLRVHDRMPALLLSRDLKTWFHGRTDEAQETALTDWRSGRLIMSALMPSGRPALPFAET